MCHSFSISKQGMTTVPSLRVSDMIKKTVHIKHLIWGLAYCKQSITVNYHYYGKLGTEPAFTELLVVMCLSGSDFIYQIDLKACCYIHNFMKLGSYPQQRKEGYFQIMNSVTKRFLLPNKLVANSF